MSAIGYQAEPATTHSPALFGRVMGLVGLTVGFATLGVFIAGDWGVLAGSLPGYSRSAVWSV